MVIVETLIRDRYDSFFFFGKTLVAEGPVQLVVTLYINLRIRHSIHLR